jgi:hypothetical protein
MSAPNVVEFVTDPQLLGLSLSPAQETLLRGIYGLPLDAGQLDLWRQCTGRETYLPHGFGEVTVLAGARSGKDSRIAAPIAVYEGILGGHDGKLSKGERAVIPIVAQDHRATKIAFGYIRDYLTGSKVLSSVVEEVLASEVSLNNRLIVSCFPCTLRSLRGWSIPAAVADEVADPQGRYLAAVDPSGGGADAFTLAIVHSEGKGSDRRVVQDVMKAWARSRTSTVDLTGVVKEIADTLRRYRLSRVVGDKYAGQWGRQAFSQVGITYADPSMDRSTAYLEAEPLFAQGRIDLLDHAILIRELKNLERRPRAGGKALIDYPKGGHDDHANALALAAAMIAKRRPGDVGITIGDFGTGRLDWTWR